MSYQHSKNLVLELYQRMDQEINQPKPQLTMLLKDYVSHDWHWRGVHPFNECFGVDAVVACFWQPLCYAFSSLQRRQDIFFAGQNYMHDGQSQWVVSMGHLLGLFDEAFLGIAATKKVVCMRYCEFNRLEQDRIVETVFFMDIPHLMVQVGLRPFVHQRGSDLVQPGPITHDGLCLQEQNPQTGAITLQLINSMCQNIGQWNSGKPLLTELRESWDERMIWWGPTGIGATYTIERYAEQHAMPFRASFSERSPTRHLARLAEGHYGGFFGWPNFSVRLQKDFLGVTANNQIGEFRVVDIYRASPTKLVENWVFIDLLHWLKCCGRDLLAEQSKY